MDGQSLVVSIIIGIVAGWIAGQIVRGGGFGLIGDLIVGIVGSFIAGWFFPGFIHIGNVLVSQIISAAIGAILLLFVLRLVRRA